MLISKESLDLVDEYNGTLSCLWMDLFFTNLLKHYLNVLNGNIFESSEISKTDYIEKILNDNEKAKHVSYSKNPIKSIQEGIRKVEAVLPIYEQFRNIGLLCTLFY